MTELELLNYWNANSSTTIFIFFFGNNPLQNFEDDLHVQYHNTKIK